jgi:hypothetical protein
MRVDVQGPELKGGKKILVLCLINNWLPMVICDRLLSWHDRLYR